MGSVYTAQPVLFLLKQIDDTLFSWPKNQCCKWKSGVAQKGMRRLKNNAVIKAKHSIAISCESSCKKMNDNFLSCIDSDGSCLLTWTELHLK